MTDSKAWEAAHDEAKFPISKVPGWFTEEDLFDHSEDGYPDVSEELEWEVLDGSAEHDWGEIAGIAFSQAQRGYPAINWLHLLRELKQYDKSCCKYGSMEEREEAKSKEAQS